MESLVNMSNRCGDTRRCECKQFCCISIFEYLAPSIRWTKDLKRFSPFLDSSTDTKHKINDCVIDVTKITMESLVNMSNHCGDTRRCEYVTKITMESLVNMSNRCGDTRRCECKQFCCISIFEYLAPSIRWTKDLKRFSPFLDSSTDTKHKINDCVIDVTKITMESLVNMSNRCGDTRRCECKQFCCISIFEYLAPSIRWTKDLNEIQSVSRQFY
ncbi:hypothetical protein J6590_087631 [Homalodisca vitripennis]|nr:hypothetical protein J6590_087631 [Homalodisca vitripennis]